MNPDLRYLSYPAVLTATLWIPYIVSQIQANGPLQAQNYQDPTPRAVPPWGKRADRTYLNAIEVFAPFAALVLVAQLSGKANAETAFFAACFFWLRLTHAIVYLLGIPFIRTLVFTLGYVALIGIFWQIVR